MVRCRLNERTDSMLLRFHHFGRFLLSFVVVYSALMTIFLCPKICNLFIGDNLFVFDFYTMCDQAAAAAAAAVLATKRFYAILAATGPLRHVRSNTPDKPHHSR